MNKYILIFIYLICSCYLMGQTKLDFFTMARGDSVVIFLTVSPRSNEGFMVYRQGPLPTNQGYELLTKELPVMPVVDPEEAKALIGEDWYLVTRAVETEEPFEVLRKIRGSEFTGGILSLISPRVAQVTGRWFLDAGAQRGREYNYKVVYVDSRLRAKDSIAKKIVVRELIPSAPTKVKASIGDKNIKLTWEYPSWKGNFDDLAVQFKIYRRTGVGTYEPILDKLIIRDDATPREYTDWWLKEDEQYAYYVTAVDPIGRESAPSESVTILLKDVTAPAIPQNLIAEAGDGVVGLSWSMNLELDVEGYNIYRSRGLDKKFDKINKKLVPLEKPFYFDSTAENGVQYFYSVSAVDKSNNESKRSNPVGTIAEDRTPPDPPANLSYKIENRILKLSWLPSKAKDVTGYYVYRGEKSEVQPKIIFEPLKATTYADSGYKKEGMSPGKTFVVSVTSVDRSRNESEKVTITVKIPDDEPPMPPQNLYTDNKEGRYVEISCGSSPSLDV